MNTVIPKYHQIYLVLREQILEGRFANGIPGEHSLAATYDVSRVTIRRALDALELEGLIAREQGRSTSILVGSVEHGNRSKYDATKTDIAGLLDNIIAVGLKTTAKVLELSDIQCHGDVANLLDLKIGVLVQKAVRVRSHNGNPMSFITTYVPSSLTNGITRRHLERHPLLTLLQGRGVRLKTVQQSIGAELADAKVASELAMQIGSALLSVRRVVADENGRPVQLLHGLYRPDRYEYRMQFSAEGGSSTELWTG